MTALVTPSDYELRAQMRALIVAADATAIVYPDWQLELLEGRSLNAARNASGEVFAAMMTRRSDKRTRNAPVPYEPEKAKALSYPVTIERTYEFRFFRRYDDAPEVFIVGEGEEAVEVTKSTEQLFNEWLDEVAQRFSRSPKLNSNSRVDRHDELQIFNRRLPSYGGEYAHTADGLLIVHLHETVTPT